VVGRHGVSFWGDEKNGWKQWLHSTVNVLHVTELSLKNIKSSHVWWFMPEIPALRRP
jgi:hypothetical protein